jgi:ligand-binding SRPBCC domain-containing protein
MACIELGTFIQAPPETCFDLCLDLDLHQDSFDHTGERIVSGRPHGRIGLWEYVTWEARHFGIRQRMTVGITVMDPPTHFQDRMLQGAFRSFLHDHHFEPVEGGTLMRDIIHYQAPLGPLGWVGQGLFLTGYLRRLIAKRNAVIKARAEGFR